MRIGTVLLLFVAILAGSFAVMTARSIIRSHAGGTGGASSTIVVAARNLSFGAVLTDDNVTEIPWSSSALPQGAFKTKAALFEKPGRRVVLSNIAQNEPILTSRITGPGQRGSLSVLIAPGMRAVTIRVDEVRGVAGFVLPDDHVDVLLTRADGRNSFTDELLQNVKVLAVDQIASMKRDRPTVARAVTLEVTPEQGEKLALAGSVGKLSLVLRKAGGAEPTATRRVTLIDLGRGEYNGSPKSDARDARLSRRIDELEAQLKHEKNMPVTVAQPVESRSASVKIVRATNEQRYSVYSEGP